MPATISVFEHERLSLGDKRPTLEGGHFEFGQAEFDALVRYHDRFGGRFLRVGHRHLSFRQYVGFMQVGPLGIEILPKADRNHDSDATPYRDALLDMLRSVRPPRLEQSSEALLRTRRSSLLEIYIAAFLDHTELLLREGLARGYRRTRANQAVFRGRLLTTEHIRHNLTRSERVFTEHQVYDHDILVNRVLDATLRLLSEAPLRHDLRIRVDRCRAAMPEGLTEWADAVPIETITLGRNTARYRKALEIAAMILGRRAPTQEAGRMPILAILFDMNVLWERYVLALLRKAAPPGIEVSGQQSQPFWRAEAAARPRFIRPDIVIRDLERERTLAILDTKWKLAKDGQPSIGDLGQMFIYNERFKAPHSMLVYPGTERDSVTRSGSFAEAGHRCSMVFLSLMQPGSFSRDFARERAKQLLDTLRAG